MRSVFFLEKNLVIVGSSYQAKFFESGTQCNCNHATQSLRQMKQTFVGITDVDVQSKRGLSLKKKVLDDISPFVGPLIPMFWTSGYISSGFQSHSGQPYSH